MRCVVGTGLLVTGLVAGCQASAPAMSLAPTSLQPAPPPPNGTYVPTGTVLIAALAEDLTLTEAKLGDTFIAKIRVPLFADNGDMVIPAGATVAGMVTGVGDIAALAAIRLNFTRIAIDGESRPFTARITATQLQDARRQSGEAVDVVAVGAIIGEGEVRDALVGGPLGIGAGTIVSLGAGGERLLPGGTLLTLQTIDRITLPR